MTAERARLIIDVPAWVGEAAVAGRAFRDDQDKMALVIRLAGENVARGAGGPFGAAVFEIGSGKVVAAGVNRVVEASNCVLHAEMVALMGLAPGFAALLALVVAMGLGVAAYHPEAYKTATSVAGERKATALSWFSLGGNVGIALGPPVITALVTVVGLTGSLGLLVPTLIATLLLLAVLPAFSQSAAPRAAAAAAARGVNMPSAMALLILVVTIRSWTTLGFTTFVPFYYIDTLGADPRLVGPLLFVFLGAGAAGTVIAGPLADRWGPRAFMQWVLLAALPFGVLFLLARGALAFVMLGIFGALLTSSFTVSVVLGQTYLPRNAGTASGLIVGFAIGAGGLGVTALGWVADRYGLPAALWISALMPLLAFATTRLLPAPRVHEAR